MLKKLGRVFLVSVANKTTKGPRCRLAMLVGVVSAASLGLGACTFLLDRNTSQCQGDWDCTRFGNSVCDLGNHVCVPAPSTDAAITAPEQSIDAEDPCLGTSGCYLCAPTTEQQILAGCTDSTCVPFDNSRLTNLNVDGTLKALP